jgi:hypothetical protein
MKQPIPARLFRKKSRTSLIFRALVLMHLTTKKMYLIQVHALSKCSRDAAQSWEGPNVTIRRYVVSNKK